MSIFEEWNALCGEQSEESFNAFWKEYSDCETKVYQHILANYPKRLEGKFSDLIKKFEARPAIFMGFMDGISDSLNEKIDLANVTEDTELSFDIDFEKLYFNMHKAGADYLFSLREWNNVFDDAKLNSIEKDYKRSKTVRVAKKPGRNDPCPCGSGKKYKNCCGRNA